MSLLMLGFLFIIFLSLVVVVVQKIANAPNAEELQIREQVSAEVEKDREIATFGCSVGGIELYIMPSSNSMSLASINHYTQVPFENVIKITPIEFTNAESKNGSALGGAAVGGVLAGGVGAIVGATAGAKSRNYTRVRQLGFIIEIYNGITDTYDRWELIILRDSTNSTVIRKAYQQFDRMLLEFKSYLPDKIVY